MNRRLRVAQISFHLDTQCRDGMSLLSAWPMLPAVARAVATDEVTLTVVQAAHTTERMHHDGVDYHFVADAAHPMRRVIEAVAALEPDVVHVHGLSFPRHMRPLSRALPGVPILAQDHGSVPPTGWRRQAWRWAHACLAGVAFTARDQALPWQRARIFGPNLPVFEVLEGSSAFTDGEREVAQRATGMSGTPCVISTSRLDANKDPLTMLAAFERAALALPGARLWCCFGEAPLLDVVQRRIASSEVLSRTVVLLGARPHAELEQRFRAADLFIQTSHREGSGFSLIEALACGATPLVTDIPAARWIVGDAGSLIPVGDVSALANAIVSWASRDQPALRARARARFDEALTFGMIGRQLRNCYASLASGTSPRYQKVSYSRREVAAHAGVTQS